MATDGGVAVGHNHLFTVRTMARRPESAGLSEAITM